jgi:hypothetical protein
MELSRKEASQLQVKKESNGNKTIKRSKQNKRLKKGQDRLNHVNVYVCNLHSFIKSEITCICSFCTYPKLAPTYKN